MLRLSIGLPVGLVVVAQVLAQVRLGQAWIPPTKVVQTTSGPVVGEEIPVEWKTRFKAFKGIPYAAPPVGDLRFKDPQPPANWTDVRYAQQYGKICPQAIRAKDSSEDCLTLNVYTPTLDGNRWPVLFWIHGGGFLEGDSTDKFYGPRYFTLERNLTVVTLNYRLGPLGFLSTNTADASGNWGLKDQLAALKWVQQNIANFDGDPNQVTIFGESAGAASVHLHILSPLSKGLFHRAILASGSGIHKLANISSEKAEKFSKNLARLLGAAEADINDPAKRVAFLRKADPIAMCELAKKVVGQEDLTPLWTPLPFLPVIENPATPGAFLTEDPRKILVEGRFSKVPMIFGVTDLEQGVLSTQVTPEKMKEIEKNVCSILPDELKNPIVAKNECAQVAQEIRDTYFEGNPFDSSMLSFVNLGSDIRMIREAYVAQRLHTKVATPDTPIYNYMFAFDGDWNFFKKQANVTLPGAIHGDDLGYYFMPEDRKIPPPRPSRSKRGIHSEVITSSRMVRLFADFAKFGDPTPVLMGYMNVKWEPVTADAAKTLVIGTEMSMENDFLKTRMSLWDKLYEKYTGSPLFA